MAGNFNIEINGITINIFRTLSTNLLKNIFMTKLRTRHLVDWRIFSVYLSDLIVRRNEELLTPNQLTLLRYHDINKWDIVMFAKLILSVRLFPTPIAEDHIKVIQLEVLLDNLQEVTQENTNEEIGDYCWRICCVLYLCGASNTQFEEFVQKIKAERFRQLGYMADAYEDYNRAIELYTRALRITGISPTDRALLYANRCETFIALNDLRNAASDLAIVLEWRPNWWYGNGLIRKYCYQRDFPALGM